MQRAREYIQSNGLPKNANYRNLCKSLLSKGLHLPEISRAICLEKHGINERDAFPSTKINGRSRSHHDHITKQHRYSNQLSQMSSSTPALTLTSIKRPYSSHIIQTNRTNHEHIANGSRNGLPNIPSIPPHQLSDVLAISGNHSPVISRPPSSKETGVPTLSPPPQHSNSTSKSISNSNYRPYSPKSHGMEMRGLPPFVTQRMSFHIEIAYILNEVT